MERIKKIVNKLNTLTNKCNTYEEVVNVVKNYFHNHKVLTSYIDTYYFLGNQVKNIYFSVFSYNDQITLNLLINGTIKLEIHK